MYCSPLSQEIVNLQYIDILLTSALIKRTFFHVLLQVYASWSFICRKIKRYDSTPSPSPIDYRSKFSGSNEHKKRGFH